MTDLNIAKHSTLLFMSLLISKIFNFENRPNVTFLKVSKIVSGIVINDIIILSTKINMMKLFRFTRVCSKDRQ